ncbi:flagellar hook-associated protein FlgK [Halalkalibacillus halophilus]|uniref:flagellar hook-associated protein FlgK n=1 Tax=Halalkalibacillus halophilus TaxID=392827 RepID=UPI00040028CB|nr:flagellar hook-associated protein FlgK [Halalkalibacillus halophilus]
MTSTFHGLEVARRALFTQQSALHTTGHNISNANTEGYSRQRVNFEQTSPFPSPARNRPEMAGQMGTGVKAGEIQRVRDSFLDFQYRAENNKAGYWDSKADALSRMEDIMNEPSDSGLGRAMDQFWESVQDVATNPEDGGARRVMQQRATAVTETFGHLNEKLTDVQGELKNQMETNADQVNTLLTQIQDLNDQIGRIEPNGYLPNDLYDQRDVLVDELSQFVNISVDYEASGGNAKANAEGKIVIDLANDNGQPIDNAQLVNADNDIQGLEFQFDDANPALVSGISVGEMDPETGDVAAANTISAADFNSPGSLLGTMQSNGYINGDGEAEGEYVGMLNDLDSLAYAFTQEFNDQHQEGYDLEGNEGGNFFTDIGEENAAANISVSENILNNENLIALASNPNAPGNGQNGLALAEVRNQDNTIGDQSIQKFYEGVIGGLGVVAEEANRMAKNTSDLRHSVNQNRESISGVSLDEEMSNMIKFQHAYNAAARNMTVVDEMLDRIINQMGIVGR